MKITTNNVLYKTPFVSFGNKKTTSDEQRKKLRGMPCEDCLEPIGRAQVLLQGKYKLIDDDEIEKLVTQIAESFGMKVSFFMGANHCISIGKAIDGFKKICTDEMKARCQKDNSGNLESIFLQNVKDKSVLVYNPNREIEKNFSAPDMKALHEYKYAPNSFHDYFRHGVESSLPSQKELEAYIETIDKIYKDDKKHWKTTSPIVVYRALPSKLSEEQTENLSKIGGVYKEKSYVSTSTNLNTAKRFLSVNPILEITVPEKAKYIDMDSLFNIDYKHWNEQELLFNRGSEFVVTGHDLKNNIIKVKYKNKP